MTASVLGFLEGPDLIVVLLVVLVLFGSQAPKLARSLGQAKTELEKGIREGAAEGKDKEKAKEDEA